MVLTYIAVGGIVFVGAAAIVYLVVLASEFNH